MACTNLWLHAGGSTDGWFKRVSYYKQGCFAERLLEEIIGVNELSGCNGPTFRVPIESREQNSLIH